MDEGPEKDTAPQLLFGSIGVTSLRSYYYLGRNISVDKSTTVYQATTLMDISHEVTRYSLPHDSYG